MWRDEWDKVAGIVAGTTVGGVVVATFRSLIVQKYGGWLQWASLLFATVFVAVLTGLSLDDSGMSQTQQWAVIGVCSFLAEDILMGFAALAHVFRNNPIGTLRDLWSAIRGQEKP